MKRALIRFALLFSLTGLVIAFGCAGGPEAVPPQSPGLPAGTDSGWDVNGQILVKFRTEVGTRQIQTLMQEMKLTMIRVVSPPRLYLVQSTGPAELDVVIQKLKDHEFVVWAEPNMTRKSG